jgi:hypothetical protein
MRTIVSTLVTDIKVGDIIDVNTGYRPLDDEDCEVLAIKETNGLFGDKSISFEIDSYHGKHWYEVPLEMVYGEKRYPTTIGVIKN